MREQIITQISLGIMSGSLKAGEKLPSTRELARRFQIHQNTISSAYRRLAECNLVELKKGSGVYVRENGSSLLDCSTLDQIINRFFHEAAAGGFSLNEIKQRLQKRFAAESTTSFLIVESDLELRKILIAEVCATTERRVDSTSLEEFSDNANGDKQQIVLIFDKANNVLGSLPPDKTYTLLKANSVADSMTGKTRPSETDLIAVVSAWGKFLELAKMFLLAARIAPETLVLRSANESNWRNGLQNVSLIICDSATAKEFPDDKRVSVFQLIAESSLNELRKSIE